MQLWTTSSQHEDQHFCPPPGKMVRELVVGLLSGCLIGSGFQEIDWDRLPRWGSQLRPYPHGTLGRLFSRSLTSWLKSRVIPTLCAIVSPLQGCMSTPLPTHLLRLAQRGCWLCQSLLASLSQTRQASPEAPGDGHPHPTLPHPQPCRPVW